MSPDPSGKEYALSAEASAGLVAACARAEWDARKHHSLLLALQQVDQHGHALFVTQRNQFSSRPGSLLDEDGSVLAEDYHAWAREQLQQHGGDATAMWKTYSARDWKVTEWRWARRYYWQQNGSMPWDGHQLEIVAEQEFPGVRLFHPGYWCRPMDASDVYNLSFSDALPDAVALGPGRYRLERSTDVARFVRTGQALHEGAQQRAGAMRVTVTPGDGSPKFESTMKDLHPESFQPTWRVQRWFEFEDWAYSSAGQSGAVAGHHWAFKFSDWDAGNARIGRQLDMVPLWSHTAKIAPINTVSLNNHELYGRLQRLDERTGGVPFSWYFYVLHGNLLGDAAARRVLAMAERGEVALPEHDYQVLRRWAAAAYGF